MKTCCATYCRKSRIQNSCRLVLPALVARGGLVVPLGLRGVVLEDGFALGVEGGDLGHGLAEEVVDFGLHKTCYDRQ